MPRLCGGRRSRVRTVAAVAKPKTDDILKALGAEQPAMVAALGADSCIACTRIAVDTLRAFSVRAKPLAVEVVIHNAEAAAHIERGQPDAIEHDPTAWSMQLGFAPHDLGDHVYNGHVVCLVEERRLLDLTLGQASRSEHGIHLGPGVFDPLPPDFETAGSSFPVTGGCVVVYRPHAEERGFLPLPHWTDRSFSQPFVRRISAGLR
jgi:hypothetical protein